MSLPMPREDHRVVFISNLSSGHDYTPASEWGAVKPVTSGNFPVFKIHRLREEVAAVIAGSNRDDCLLLSGSSMVAAMCLVYWFMMHEQVHLLLYDKKTAKYVLRTILKDELILDIEARQP